MNPFKVLYWKQFGGGPTPAELKQMGFDKAPTDATR